MSDATAVHEAGHAVVGRKLGMLCGQASIVADEDSSGHSITADPYAIHYHWDCCGHYRDFRSVLRGRVITFMAGREAEVAIIGSCAGGDGDDDRQIGLMIAELADAEEEQAKLEARLRRSARMLVRRHRVLIQEVACELEAHGTIASDELDSLSNKPVRVPLNRLVDQAGTNPTLLIRSRSA